MYRENPAHFLGLTDHYNLYDLKTRYKKLALKYHPDQLVVPKRYI